MNKKIQPAKKKKNNVFSLLLRLALSFGLLAWVFSKIDMNHTWEVIRSADVGLLSWAAVVFLGINFIILLRWFIVIRALDLKLSLGTVIKWFFIGLACNLFLPTSVGGDVIKTIGLSSGSKEKPKILASVVLDRLSGFAGVVIVASVMFVVGYRFIPDQSVGFSILVMMIVSLALTSVLFSHRIFSFFCRVFNRLPKIKDAVMSVHYNIVLMKEHAVAGVTSVALSVLAQIILAYCCFVIAKALHQDVDFFYFMIFSPMICVVTSLPSIGGLGVREMGWAYLLSKVGVAQGVAVSISLINFVFMVGVGLIGGVIYVVTLFNRRVQPDQARLDARPKKA